ncbi:MAG: acyl carrier protein [Planctomycetes bacterium]|jgi:acyl carrier protein|nr:acyl carrier protein [Phycisphaerae bacterium]NBB96424.1 acyl carrier protein [Planctomycetota bacterium]
MVPLDNLLKQIFKVGDLPTEATMNDIETWDSLTHMDLVTEIETTYDIALTGDEIADMQSIGAIRQVLQTRGVA